MTADENKVCFIICVNDDFFFEECIRYIQWLDVPDGMKIEVLEIREAVSMAAGYNEGMNSSDAKYKVYMHQDTFIVSKRFIYDIVSIFKASKDIGLIGLIGTREMPPNGIMWHSERVGFAGMTIPKMEYRYDMNQDGWWEVEAVDGLLMVAQYDIPWREDLFDGWDFYDISYGFEMRRRGLSVIVPRQRQAWFLHNDKEIMTMWNYEKYRNIFIHEYMKDREPVYVD